MGAAVKQFAIDRILDQRHIVAVGQLHQALLVSVRHHRARGILKIRHDHAGGNFLRLQQGFQCIDIDSRDRIGGNLNGAHTHALNGMQHGIEGRRFDGDRVARSRHSLQAEVDGLGRADGNHHILGIDV